MSIDVNVQNDLVIVTESSEDITVNVSNAAGPQGPAGVGVPVGGTTGQVLKKQSGTDYDTFWALDGVGVPYSGATGNVDLGDNDLEAGSVFVEGAAGAGGALRIKQFGSSAANLDGYSTISTLSTGVFYFTAATTAPNFKNFVLNPSGITDNILRTYTLPNLDGTLALLSDIPSLTGFVPYTGATTNVDLGTHRILAQNATIASSGSGDTVTLTHSSGSGIGLNITKGGSGEGLYINKTSGSGNAATIIGTLNATTLVKSGGTSSQFLKADGSVDSTTYVGGSGTSGQVAYWNGTNSQTGSNNLFWDAANSRLGIGTNAPLLINEISSATNTSIPGLSSATLDGAGLGIGNTGTNGFAVFGQNNAGQFYIQTRSRLANGTAFQLLLNPLGGNLSIGATSDSGQRLQVYGDAFIKGSGATSATTALTVQNSDAVNFIRARNDGRIILGSLAVGSAPFIQPSNGSTALNIDGSHLYFGNANNDNSNAGPAGYWFEANFSALTGGQSKLLNLTGTFTGATGAEHTNLRLSYTINQAVGSTGITRGLYVNPTLTAAADWRSIEWSNNSGWGLYGDGTANNYLGGDLRVNQTGATNAMIFASTTGRSNVVAIRIGGSATQASSMGFYSNQTINSSNSSEYISFNSAPNIESGTYSVTNITSYSAASGAKSAGVTITNMYGFYAANNLNKATNNFAFYGDIPNATNSWNLYMAGTADNYLAGKLLIGTITVGTFALDVNGTARVSGNLTVTGVIYTDAVATRSGASIDFRDQAAASIMYLDATNKRVGIGTTSPAAKLDVVGAAIFSSSVTATSFIKSGGTSSQYLMADGSVTMGSALTITNRQTASYTLALTDADKLVEMNVATANNLTVPLNSSIAFPIGTKIDLAQYGAGQTTVVATGGVTVRSAGGALKLAVQYSGASLVKIATDEWYLFGDITV